MNSFSVVSSLPALLLLVLLSATPAQSGAVCRVGTLYTGECMTPDACLARANHGTFPMANACTNSAEKCCVLIQNNTAPAPVANGNTCTADGYPGTCTTEAACLARSDTVVYSGLANTCATCCVSKNAVRMPLPTDDSWKLPYPCLIEESIGSCLSETECFKLPNSSYHVGSPACTNSNLQCCVIGPVQEWVPSVPDTNDPNDCSKDGVAGVCVNAADCAVVPNRRLFAGSVPGVDKGCAGLPNDIQCCVEVPPATSRPVSRPTPKPAPPSSTSPRIRIGAAPTRNCNLVSPQCSHMYEACGNDIVVDEEFMPFVAEFNKCARTHGTRIGICSTYRNIARNRRVGGASSSNHLVGHAIDMMIRDRNGRACDEACMLSVATRNARPGVPETLACFTRVPRAVWGGTPSARIMIRGHLDVVHLDDRINVRYPREHVAKRTACNADRVFQAANCASYEQDGPSLLEAEQPIGFEDGVDSMSSEATDNTGMIVGIVIGAVVLIVACGVAVFLWVRSQRRTQFHIDVPNAAAVEQK
jgi:hypothetical protein